MPLYETVFIARNDVSQAQVEAMVDNISQILEENEGKIIKKEFWGLRNLAYRIKKNRKGHYVLLGIDSPVAAMKEMERNLSLNEDLLRSMILKVDEIDEGQSPILTRRDDRHDKNNSSRNNSQGPKKGGRFESGRHRASAHKEETENTAGEE